MVLYTRLMAWPEHCEVKQATTMLSSMTVFIVADSDIGGEAKSSMSMNIVHWFCTTQGGRLTPYLLVASFSGRMYSGADTRQESPATERRWQVLHR